MKKYMCTALNINVKLTDNRIKNHELVMKNLINHYIRTKQEAENAVNDLYSGTTLETYTAKKQSIIQL